VEKELRVEEGESEESKPEGPPKERSEPVEVFHKSEMTIATMRRSAAIGTAHERAGQKMMRK